MTEKRFYYNTFYYPSDMDRVMEYEIIDSESYPNYPNHDEKEDLPNWVIYISENDSGWQDMLVDLLNEQDQRIKELEEQLKLVCEADCVTPHDSVKEILRDEIKGIDTVAGESAMAWHDYCVLDKVFKEQYDNELWDNYD